MSDLLDKIDKDLDDTETRILLAFKKLHETPDELGVGQLSQDFRDEIHYMVTCLQESLDKSGSKDQLLLTTERHEDFRTRLYVINQLLDRQVPLTAFNKADRELNILSRQSSQTTPVNPRPQERDSIVITSVTSKSIMNSLKEFFGKNRNQSGGSPTIITEQEYAGNKEIYKEAGVYAAAQELAMLALVVGELRMPKEQKKEQRNITTGKASFAAKDIASVMDTTDLTKKQSGNIASSPEEIRKKLEARRNQTHSTGKASFAAQEVSGTMRASAINTNPKVQKKKVTAQPNKAKAKFGSRDIRSIATDTNKLREKLADRFAKPDPNKKD